MKRARRLRRWIVLALAIPVLALITVRFFASRIPVIDLRRLRDDAAYRQGAVNKGASTDAIDELLTLDSSRRDAQQIVEELRARSNAASKDIGKADPAEREAKIAAAGEIKSELQAKEAELAEAAAKADAAALEIPNPATESSPVGGELL